MMKRVGTVNFLFVLLSPFYARAVAAPVVVGMTAEVTNVTDLDGVFENRINPGDVLVGKYAYDPTTLDNNPLVGVGDYWHDDAPYGVSLSIGGFVFQTNPINTLFLLEICNDLYGHDTYLLRSYNNLPFSGEIGVDTIEWVLHDYTCSALNSAALQMTPPILGDWDTNYLLITVGEKGGAGYIQATVTSVELVPEPTTVLMLGFGGVGILRRRRRFSG